MEFPRPPAWMTRQGDPGRLIRPEIRNDMVALWLPSVGHGGSQLWDISGNKNHGPFPGGSRDPHPIVSKIAPALYFNLDYITLPKLFSDTNYSFSLGFYLNWHHAVYDLFVSQDDGSGRDWFVAGTADSKMQITIHASGGRVNAVSASDIPQNQWVFLFASVDNNAKTIKGYIDGNEVISTTYSGDTTASSTYARISGWSGTDNLLVGVIGPMALWGCSLPEEKIHELTGKFWNTVFYKPDIHLGVEGLPGATTTIRLSWTSNSASEDGFSIERKTGAGAYSEIDTVAAGVETYDDTVDGGYTYTYRVKATSAALGDSEYSNEAEVTVS